MSCSAPARPQTPELCLYTFPPFPKLGRQIINSVSESFCLPLIYGHFNYFFQPQGPPPPSRPSAISARAVGAGDTQGFLAADGVFSSGPDRAPVEGLGLRPWRSWGLAAPADSMWTVLKAPEATAGAA